MLFIIILLVIVFMISVYLYHCLKNFVKVFKEELSKGLKIVLKVVSFLLAALMMNIFSLYTLFMFHFIVINMICEGICYLLFKENQFLKKICRLCLLPICLSALLLGYGYVHIRDVHMTHYTIQTKKSLSQSYRIAYLSDLHYSNTMNKKRLEEYCHQIENYKPDVIILGGDIVDEQTTYTQLQEVFETIGNMTCPDGIYYVYGNHDHSSYTLTPNYTVNQLNKAITSNNIILLSDTLIQIDNELTIVGRDDRSFNKQRRKSEDFLQFIDDDHFILLLDHQPVELQKNNMLKYDLQLSGHTHSGQIFPLGYFIDMFGEMNYGYKSFDHLQVITSSGMVGWGYPIRTQGISEFVIIDIVGEI